MLHQWYNFKYNLFVPPKQRLSPCFWPFNFLLFFYSPNNFKYSTIFSLPKLDAKMTKLTNSLYLQSNASTLAFDHTISFYSFTHQITLNTIFSLPKLCVITTKLTNTLYLHSKAFPLAFDHSISFYSFTHQTDKTITNKQF